jgi:hypothetical protein
MFWTSCVHPDTDSRQTVHSSVARMAEYGGMIDEHGATDLTKRFQALINLHLQKGWQIVRRDAKGLGVTLALRDSDTETVMKCRRIYTTKLGALRVRNVNCPPVDTDRGDSDGA